MRYLLSIVLLLCAVHLQGQSAHVRTASVTLHGDVTRDLALIEKALVTHDRASLERARLLELKGEQYYQLSDIGEAQQNWNVALSMRQRLFGDSSAEAGVGYAYQARYHSYMSGPQLDHQAVAYAEAARAKHLLATRKGGVKADERIFVLREFAYAYKILHLVGAEHPGNDLGRTRSFFREALRIAEHTKDTLWIAQLTHDIGNTFTDQIGWRCLPANSFELHSLVDSGLTHYRRSMDLLSAMGQGASEAMMMEHYTTALLYKFAYGQDSSQIAIAAFDQALLTMLAPYSGSKREDPLHFEPRLANKAQMVELLFQRALAYADQYQEPPDTMRLRLALKSLEAAVPYWWAMLREYRSRDIQKVMGSYSHSPFRYGTHLAAELYGLNGDPARLQQALGWYDLDRGALEQRDLLRSGASAVEAAISQAHIGSSKLPEGTMLVAFHGYPWLMAIVMDHTGTRIIRPGIEKLNSGDLAQLGTALRRAMKEGNVEDYRRIGNALYVNTLKDALVGEKVQELIIVPDGPMAFLPFEALLADTVTGKNWGDLPYLRNRTTVRYARSIRGALKPAITLSGGRFNYVVADVPGLSLLPFANALVRRQEERKGEPLSTAPLTRARLGALMHGEVALHIATHAEALDVPDAIPHLLLTDGSLTLNDIDSIGCTAPLVVLSTCSSGEGRVFIGEGAMSLGNAFLRSGAQAVVETLWPVDDQATSEVLERMYAYMDEGRSVSEALSTAKADHLREHADGALANPFYWAGIVTTGAEVRSVPKNSSARPFWWMGGAFILAVGAGAGYRRSRRFRRSSARSES
ncbi:MAG: CHAT domain-containing protein [Flavobacteriales bacterium]